MIHAWIPRSRSSALLIVSLLTLFQTFPGDSLGWEGKAVSVVEADSLVVMVGTKKERIDLYGIDAPGKGQEFADAAKDFTIYRIRGKTLQIEPAGKSRHGRTLAIVTVDDRVLNQELVRNGLAWFQSQSCTRPVCGEWRDAQKLAKREKLNTWSLENPLPPWEFRKDKPSPKSVYSGNIVTHVFHSTNCEEFDCWNCIASFKGREAAVRAGYKPCELCSP
jgi:micrococcal nuclease